MRYNPLTYLRGSNLEVFKFGMYLAFPIGWMYYFGTNLDARFNVPQFWPTQEQSHKIPYDSNDLKLEVRRIQQEAVQRQQKRRVEVDEALDAFKKERRGKEADG